MGLKAVIKSAVTTVFEALDDLPRSVVYTHAPSAPRYNPTLGTATAATPTTITVSALFAEYDAAQVDNQRIFDSDCRIYIPAVALGCTPTLHDYITYGGKRFNILNRKTDPAGAMWDLQTREP